MDTFAKVIGVISALVGLVTACLAYRQKRVDSQANRLGSLAVVEIDYGTRKQFGWSLRKWVALMLGLLCAVLTVLIVFFIREGEFGEFQGRAAVQAIFFGMRTIGYAWMFAVLRRDPL